MVCEYYYAQHLYFRNAKDLLPCYARHCTNVEQESHDAPQGVQRLMERPGAAKGCSRSCNRFVIHQGGKWGGNAAAMAAPLLNFLKPEFFPWTLFCLTASCGHPRSICKAGLNHLPLTWIAAANSSFVPQS